MRNNPPPGSKLVGDWKGMRVRSTRELRNGWGSMPAGSFFRVTHATAGIHMKSEPCACCGFQWSVSKVSSDDIEPVPDGVGAAQNGSRADVTRNGEA